MKERLIAQVENRALQLTQQAKVTDEKIIRKLTLLEKRKATIVKVTSKGYVRRVEKKDEKYNLFYNVHFKFLIKQGDHFYVEEELEEREASFYKEVLVIDRERSIPTNKTKQPPLVMSDQVACRESFIYDRLEAVRYAEIWWNDYNPAYIQFDVDCTNYVSQCLYAGGAPMRGYPKRTHGWWYRGQNNNWSFSWSVANALKVYLTHSTIGLRAMEVEDPLNLQWGDVICYDFQGDGRFDHTTIVTGKDAYGMPLVNAHTANSRMRYWTYEDSTAYTPDIEYKMFTIIDDHS